MKRKKILMVIPHMVGGGAERVAFSVPGVAGGQGNLMLTGFQLQPQALRDSPSLKTWNTRP